MNGPGFALRRLAPPLLAASLAACAAHAPVASGPGKWAYLGNDPEGTQNIYMRGQSVDKKSGIVTAEFRFEFTGPSRKINMRGTRGSQCIGGVDGLGRIDLVG